MKFNDGVLIANLMPFNQDLSINWEALASHTQKLQAIDGIRGFVVNAYAGEGPALTLEERTRAVALHRELAKPDQAILACVLDMSTQGAIEQAKAYKQAGADALLICPPVVSGWKAADSPHVAVEYHKAIAAAVDLPLFLFQLSIGDSVAYSHELLMTLVKEVKGIVGVKMAQANDAVRYDMDYLGLQQMGRPIVALPSVASSMFHNLTTGGEGILTGLATFAPHEMVELWKSTKSGNYARAREIHLQLAELNHLIYGHPYVDLHTRYKEVAYQTGVIPTPYLRGPQVRVSETERQQLQAALTRAKIKPL